MHAVVGGEDVVEVGEDFVGGESYKLTPTPKHSAEEVEGIEGVGECSEEPIHIAVVIDLLNMELSWRATGEVAVAGRKEELCEIPCAPPP